MIVAREHTGKSTAPFKRPDRLPVSCPETTVVLPGKRIFTLGVQHGQYLQDIFPDREFAEQSLQKTFPKGVTAMVVDSFSQMEQFPRDYDPTAIATNRSYPDMDLGFFDWAMRYAAKHGVWIIGADFNNSYNDKTSEIIDGEQKTTDNNPTTYTRRLKNIVHGNEYTGLQTEMDTDSRVAFGVEVLSYTTMAALMMMGLQIISSEEEISRRNAIKTAGAFGKAALVTGVAIAAGSAMESVRGFLQRRDTGLKQRQRDLLENAGFNPNIFIPGYPGIEQDVAKTAYEADTITTNKLITNGQLTGAACANPAVIRFEAEVEKDLPYTELLRNAFIAEIATLPNQTLLPNFIGNEADIACVMGYDHLTVRNDYSIPGFIANPELRHAVLTKLVSALYKGVRSGKYPDITPEFITDRLNSMGRSYRIFPDGSVAVHTFAVPFINQLIAQNR